TPEIARVGLDSRQAAAQAIAVDMTRFSLSALDRAACEGREQGWVEVLTARGQDKIVGATVIGAHAGELISEYCLAIDHNLGLKQLLATVRPYPTWQEANRLTAGQWRRAHQPAWLAPLLRRYHTWRRGH
ncbi:MAG: pyridine nucleotide-disulfide oxidoreductase, partial [Aeromonas sp.]